MPVTGLGNWREKGRCGEGPGRGPKSVPTCAGRASLRPIFDPRGCALPSCGWRISPGLVSGGDLGLGASKTGGKIIQALQLPTHPLNPRNNTKDDRPGTQGWKSETGPRTRLGKTECVYVHLYLCNGSHRQTPERRTVRVQTQRAKTSLRKQCPNDGLSGVGGQDGTVPQEGE